MAPVAKGKGRKRGSSQLEEKEGGVPALGGNPDGKVGKIARDLGEKGTPAGGRSWKSEERA